jgi:hypothetical protein
MTDSERRAHRIAKNRELEQRSSSGNAGLSLDGIVGQLDARKRRATYKAVADLVGVPHRSLMSGRVKSYRDSWIVAGSGTRRGWPTDYTVNQIQPDCYRQICERVDDFISSAEELKKWLQQLSR